MSRGAQSGTATYDVFVGNLPADAHEKQITKHFSQYGEIQSLALFNNKNGPGKVSFVRYYTESDAESACQGTQGLEISGKKVMVRMAKKGGSSGAGGTGGGRRNFTNRNAQESGISPDIVPQSEQSERRVSQGSESSNHSHFGDSSKEESVLVTHVESAICVWVQTITEQFAEALKSMTNKLQVTCPAASKVKGTPSTYKHYAATYSQDGNWYRCIVKQVHSIKGKVKILYVDFGNIEEKAIEDLVEIPQSLSNVKPFAKKIVFYGLAIKNDFDSDPVSHNPFLAGIQFLQEKTEGQKLRAKQILPLKDNMGYIGELFVENQSISELVLQKGFAIRRNMLPSKSSPRNQGVTESSPQRTTVNPSFMSNSDRNRSSRNEAAEFKMCLEKERAEKDMLTLELATLKGKLKSAQAEHSAMATKIVESTLDHKIKSIAALVQKVTELRKQFPSDDNAQDYLTTSFSIAFAEDHISLDSITSLRRVNKALEDYTNSQETIRACKTQEELEGLIQLRDDRRHDLHTSLQLFLQESSRMPLDERLTKVKSVLQSLEESYSGFIHFIINKPQALGNARTLYDEWKAKVLSGFQEVRGQTDTVQQTLKATLNHIQQVISMEELGLSSSMNYDLDSLFKTYIIVLQKELTITDVEHSSEACQMASIIHEVRRVFEEELRIIDSLKRLNADFSRQNDSIEEWLHRKPDLQDIRNVRKTLRSMKSKLRHLLADQEDLDENDSGSDEERNRIQTELAGLRSDLQKTLLIEEELMMKYSALAENHFPELKLTNADLNLDLCQAYCGMLKTSREIDHYNLVQGADQGSYQVNFANTDATIKEYVIDDRIHSSKEEFLKQALNYSRVCSPYLSPVEAVFMSKNQKQVYLQTQGSGVTLLDFVKKEAPQPWVIQKVLRCVTEGLGALHQAGISHGALSPQTVMVADGKVAQLSVPDFSRPAADPSRSWFVTKSGVEFKAPEEGTTKAPTMASDLYHLGLLSIWIHLPHTELAKSPSGSPELRELPLNEDILQVAQSLLLTPPISRVRASEILQAEYFCNTIPDLLLVESVTEDCVSQEDTGTEVDDQIPTSLLENTPCIEDIAEAEGLSSVNTDPGLTDSVDNEVTTKFSDLLVDTAVNHVPAASNPSNPDVDFLPQSSGDINSETVLTSDATAVPLPEAPNSSLPGESLDNNNTLLVDLVSPISMNQDPGVTAPGASQDPMQEPLTAEEVDKLKDFLVTSEGTRIGPTNTQVTTGLDTLLLDSPNDMAQFTVDQNTVDTLSSMVPLPPLDGSGDAKEPSALVAAEVDNATLMQNLLRFTAQELPKNLGF